MATEAKTFLKKAEKKAFDLDHRKTIRFNIGKYDAAVAKGKTQYTELELAKMRAAKIKDQVVNNLDKYLLEFESNFESRGGKVLWAKDAAEAIQYIQDIFEKRAVKKVVKMKSMITEELELNEALEKKEIEVLETDLGEYIVQLDNDKPYHIITPVMHKSKQDIAELFNKKFGTDVNLSAEELTGYVRELLRKKFVEADAGITGANFLVADTGSVALTENEGNGVMSVSWPKVHISIAGIEKLIPSMKDFDLFWPLLATHGTGQRMTVYNSLVSGPKKSDEKNGPEEMFVILLDNGRSNLLAKKEQRSALRCIRCGACLNVCPVYKNIGGHTYGTTYSGPIGSIISPHLRGMHFKHLSYASSLCGMCTQECPVKIPIHEILLLNRRDSVNQGHNKKSEAYVIKGYKMVMKNRWMINSATPAMKRMFMATFVKKSWGPRRDLPPFREKSFNKYWRTKKK